MCFETLLLNARADRILTLANASNPFKSSFGLPGYVKSYREKVSISCNGDRNAFNYYHQRHEPQTSYVKYKPAQKCTGSTTLGGLIGGGIAASLSKSDAYAWSIPLGAVLGAGIGNAQCK